MAPLLPTMKTFGKKYMDILLRGIHTLSFSPSHVKEPHIHRLPVELLQEVFLLVVNDVPDCPSIFSFGKATISVDVASPPLVLTRVCRLWRVVAHSTTGVWSRIQVGLPGRVQPLKPFLSDLLQCWLARSGSRPLTLRIVNEHRLPYRREHIWPMPSEENSGLLDILLSQSKRWETVVMLSVHDRSHNFDTPQLKTFECYESDLSRFNAPNLSRLCVDAYLPEDIQIKELHTPARKSLRYLHLPTTSMVCIYSTLVFFPHLETIIVDKVLMPGTFPGIAANSCLKSMTIPLHFSLSDDYCRQMFIEMFSRLHLPMLRKLTPAGPLKKLDIDGLLAALAVSSFHVPVVDFQTSTQLRKVKKSDIKRLLSVVGEVTVCGNLLQTGQDRDLRRKGKLKLPFSR